jgi:GSCFA family
MMAKSPGPAQNPYIGLPSDRFWRSAVSEQDALAISGLWTPRLRIRPRTRILTAGSCFAQHIGRALAARGYQWVDGEPAPARLPPAVHKDFHYGTFSFRTGNIYTPRMLEQWLAWAVGDTAPPDEVWDSDGRYVDPVRPAVEPGGFVSRDEVQASRDVTLMAIRRAVSEADLFVFTLGLTEAWVNRETGLEYAVCPGTVAGQFDPKRHGFVNHGFVETLSALTRSLALLRQLNPDIKLLLTVSPVPLTATASGQHVLTATSYSKSVLRAVAGALVETDAGVDYFPSYEIITAPPFGGRFYAANQRSVEPAGVNFVMDSFFADQGRAFGRISDEEQRAPPVRSVPVAEDPDAGEADDIRCEEEILDAFSR